MAEGDALLGIALGDAVAAQAAAKPRRTKDAGKTGGGAQEAADSDERESADGKASLPSSPNRLPHAAPRSEHAKPGFENDAR